MLLNSSLRSLYLHEVPERPWQKVGVDIFTISSRNYLVTVDYLSGFYEVDFLPDMLSETVVCKLKYHFARYGIPDVVVSDNGPQFSADHFMKFARKWEFSHERISPGNSKANGAAEAAVKDAKKFMKKCSEEKSDPYLGLLNVRNTPTEGLSSSPAQRLLGRRTKTCIPTTTSRLQQPYSNLQADRERKEEKQNELAKRLDQHRHDLPPLQPGARVWMQPIDKAKEWQPAVITDKTSSCSYVVEMNGKSYRRNRQFLRPDRSECPEARSPASSSGSTSSVPSTPAPSVPASKVDSPTTSTSPPHTPLKSRIPVLVSPAKATPVKTPVQPRRSKLFEPKSVTTRSGLTTKVQDRLNL